MLFLGDNNLVMSQYVHILYNALLHGYGNGIYLMITDLRARQKHPLLCRIFKCRHFCLP